MLVALVLCAFGVINLNAQTISLQEVPFWQHEIWGIDEPMTTPAECAWVVDEPTGMPYGDDGVNNFADLSSYKKLIVTAKDGTPRFLLNRDADEGQWNATEAESHLIDNTRSGWSSKYFSSVAGDEEGVTIYTVDLKQLVNDKGYAHLHAIKGANWTNVTVMSMELEGSILGAQFSNEAVEVSFGFDTNIPELVKQSGSKRVFFDNSCAEVKVNGDVKEIFSVEGFDDGRFYIFMADPISADATVEVTVTNNIGLVYTSGTRKGSPVDDFNGIATYNRTVEDNDGFPYYFVAPTVMSTNPDDGSFNLDPSTVFTVTFDKVVDCERLEAYANGTPMTISPNSGFAKEVTLSGSLSNGVYNIKVTKAYAEGFLDDEYYGEYEFSVSIGRISSEEMPYDVIPADYFANCPAGGIPEGFFVDFGGEERPGGSSFGSGSRMFDFAAGGDFTKGLYIREGYAEFGSTPDYDLYLEAGKKYTLTFNSCMWKSSGGSLDLKIFSADDTDNALFTQTVTNAPDVNGSTAAVTGTTKTTINFIPEASGNYIVRWDRPGFNEVIIANVVMKFVPDVPGLEYAIMLNNALDDAKKALEANSDERYAGEAYNNLQAVIAQYDGWESTSPKAYEEAAAALQAATEAMNNHHVNCDEYDTQVKKAIDVVRQNEMPNGDPAQATKFVATELFAQLKDIVAKYHGSSEWVNIGTEEEAQWQLNYSYDQLTDDAQLAAAAKELKDIATLTSLLFTEGVSSVGGSNGGKATGVAVFIDRLRLGAESLKALGDDNNPLIATANNALTDDDEIAEKLKTAIKQIVYGQLKDENNTLFDGIVDEVTLEETTPTYDVTVFVKNPNIYKQLPNMNYTDDNVPGWITPEGYNRPGLSVGWGAPYNVEGVPEDCMFQSWGGSYRVEQTITDMPAGIYTIMAGFSERIDDGSVDLSDTYFYAMTSDGLEYDAEANVGGQAFPFANGNGLIITDVEVTDGELTIGVNAGEGSHTFFNEVRILLTAPVNGFDYAAAYDEIATEPVFDGDVNDDGEIDVADISAILTHMAGNQSYAKADVNQDGSVDVADISKVLSIMAELARRAAVIEEDETEVEE